MAVRAVTAPRVRTMPPVARNAKPGRFGKVAKQAAINLGYGLAIEIASAALVASNLATDDIGLLSAAWIVAVLRHGKMPDYRSNPKSILAAAATSMFSGWGVALYSLIALKQGIDQSTVRSFRDMLPSLSKWYKG